MIMRELGQDGPQTSTLGYGCMSLGGGTGATDEGTGHAALDAAWDIGINFLDTANVYGPHISEQVIGTWLKSRGHKPVIATKAGILRDPENPTTNDPAYLEAELEGSLNRMGVDHVDLFYIHRRNPATPIADVAGFMQRMIDKGKIGGWGLSEVSPTTLRAAHAETPVTAVQNEYSLWTRQPELGLIQDCAKLGVAFVPFSPIARGVLGSTPFDVTSPDLGPFREQMPRFQEPHWSANQAKANAFRTLAADNSVTAPALALAWILAKGDHMFPIPGARTTSHVREWTGAHELATRADLLAQVDNLLPVGWAFGDRYSVKQSSTAERYC